MLVVCVCGGGYPDAGCGGRGTPVLAMGEGRRGTPVLAWGGEGGDQRRGTLSMAGVPETPPSHTQPGPGRSCGAGGMPLAFTQKDFLLHVKRSSV